jgi:CheY-like chemotaxis protein/CRP-like cAMP-binding protein
MKSFTNAGDGTDAEAIKVLLVDDEPQVLNALQRLLRSDRYQLYIANSGAEALTHLEQTRIEVVISDIRMPGMSGNELLAQIAARWPDISRIALTGGTGFADAVEAINNAAIFRWVHKPWDAEHLRRTVQEGADRFRKIHTIRRRFQTAARPSGGDEPPPQVSKKYFKGELIFQEGSAGQLVHFIQVGKVELSMERDGRRIIVDTRRAGDCFGVTSPLLGARRSVTATAVEYTETFCVARELVHELLGNSDALIASMVKSMARQSRRALLNLVARNPVVNALESAACALDLMARAAAQKGGSTGASSAQLTVKLPQQEVIPMLSQLLGMMKRNALELLEQMAQMNLISIDATRQVAVRPGEIVGMAKNLCANHGDSLADALRAEAELLDIDELAELVGVEKSHIQRTLAQGELPQNLWAFRKTEALRLVQDKGREFFRRHKIKKPEEIDSIGDILGIDRNTLGRALSKVDPYRLGGLLRRQDKEIQERALASLSSRVKSMVTESMNETGYLDEVELELVEAEIIESIKSLKGVGGP